jgi:hypothetical protein
MAGALALLLPLVSQAGTDHELTSCPITKAHYHYSSAPGSACLSTRWESSMAGLRILR